MFTHSYFAASFFPGSYFPPVVAEEAEETRSPAVAGAAIIRDPRKHSVEDPRVQFVRYVRGYYSQIRDRAWWEEEEREKIARRVEEMSPEDSTASLRKLAQSLQSVISSLPNEQRKSLPPLVVPPLGRIETTRVGDFVTEQSLDEDDELLIMMLLQ